MSNRDELKEESPYKCSLCDRAFANRAELEQHQATLHHEEQTV